MRARSIKPGICDNELLGTADPFYTLLFERLWMMADREGRLEDRPMRIKAQAFPYRDGLDIDPMLQWLHDHGFIQRYTLASTGYIQVTKFTDHQHPHVKEGPSKIPAPDSPGASTSPAPDKNGSGSGPGPEIPAPVRLTPSSLTPDSGLRTPDSSSLRSPRDDTRAARSSTAERRTTATRGVRIPTPFLLTAKMRAWAKSKTPDVDVEPETAEFFDYWRTVPGQKGCKLDWVLTWQVRMRELQRRAKPRQVNGVHKPSFDERLAALDPDGQGAKELGI